MRGPGDSELRYGGRVDLYVTLDGRDIAIWNGLRIHLHPEFVYGKNVNTVGAGVLLPPKIALSFPSTDGEEFDLSLYLVQQVGGGSLTLGKLNMLDVASRTPVLGGRV